jgi:hypothetical protein
MVVVSTSGTKIRGLKPAEAYGFLRAIKIRSMIFFGGGSKAVGLMS